MDVKLIKQNLSDEGCMEETSERGPEVVWKGGSNVSPRPGLQAVFFGGVVTEVKSISGQRAMEEAYEMGKKI